MADTETPLLQLVDQENGANDNTWGDIEDANKVKVEKAIAGATNKAITGGTITLTDDEARPAILILTGALTSNAIVQAPTRTKTWLAVNETTGNYTVTMKTASGAGYVLPRGRPRQIFCDGANVRSVDAAGSVPIGGILHLGVASLGLDDVDFLQANGALVSRTGYATLYAKIGNTFHPGDGSTTFGLPDLQNRYLRGPGSYATGSYLADEIKAHSHTASTDEQGWHAHSGYTDAQGQHDHGYYQFQDNGGFNPGSTGSFTAQWAGDNFYTATSAAGSHSHNVATYGAGSHYHNISVGATGGGETRPYSTVALGIIRFQ